jgi:hypothetical protein
MRIAEYVENPARKHELKRISKARLEAGNCIMPEAGNRL